MTSKHNTTAHIPNRSFPLNCSTWNLQDTKIFESNIQDSRQTVLETDLFSAALIM